MTTVNFKEANLNLAENQPEYQTLPVLVDNSKTECPVTCCFQLDEAELKEIAATGRIWLTQLTFGNAVQPILMTTRKPF